MKRFLRWLRVYRAPYESPATAIPNVPPSEPAGKPGTDDVARTVIEQLSDDESLRRNLTDGAFKPIFDLVTSLVPAAVDRVGAQPSAGDQLTQSARQLVRGLSAAVSSGDPSLVTAGLLQPFMTEAQIQAALAARTTSELPGQSDEERAKALVQSMKSVLERGQA